jgi:hypothetical protein
MTTTINPIVFVITSILLITVSVFWADWIIKELFAKDINNWLLLGGLLAIGLCIPRALNGILSLSMVIASLYILFIR